MDGISDGNFFDEYYELEGEEQVTVLCYPRTERILKFCDFADRHHVSD